MRASQGLLSRFAVNITMGNAKIKAPTLLFWGEKDTATPLSDAKRMEKLIPDAGLVTVAGAGHYSFLENMPLFVRVLESFLAKEMKR